MEFLLGYSFGMYIGFILILVLLFVFEVTEHNAGAIGVTLGCIILGLYYSDYSFSINHLWYVIVYLFIGFIFALIRTFFKGRELKQKDEEWNSKADKSFTVEYKKNYNLKAAVFRWWLIWPISGLAWFCGRIVVDIFNYLYSKLQGLFEKVFYN